MRSALKNYHQHLSTEEEIYRLRYEAYLDNGSIYPNSDEMFWDEYDSAPNCFSHLEYVDGVPAASIRANVYDPARPMLRVSAMDIFDQEIAANIGYDKKFVHANRLVIHPKFQNFSRKIKMNLLRFVFDLAIEKKVAYIVGAPRAVQAKFYEHMLFKKISGEKKCPSMNFNIVLMACALSESRWKIRTHPKYQTTLQKYGFV